MNKTAVEWLIDQVEDFYCLLPVDMIEKAKEMEKEQKMKFAEEYEQYAWKISNENRCAAPKTPEQYYNETYEQD